MTVLREGNVEWTFPDGWIVCKYDDWSFYRKQFEGRSGGGTRAVDLVVVEPNGKCLWLIEAKDYTFEQRSPNKEPIEQEVAKKARDTLSGLMAARVRASGEEQETAAAAAASGNIRVVLHLELPTAHRRGYGRGLDPAAVQEKLRRQVKAIDPHPIVLDSQSTLPLAWKAEWKSERGGA